MSVHREAFEELECVRHAVAPIAQDPGGGGAGARVGRREHLVEQRTVDDIMPLMNPECLHAMVLDARVVFIQASQPA